jgi:hypothetical protein
LNSFHIVANRDKSDPKEIKGLQASCKPYFCEFSHLKQAQNSKSAQL